MTVPQPRRPRSVLPALLLLIFLLSLVYGYERVPGWFQAYVSGGHPWAVIPPEEVWTRTLALEEGEVISGVGVGPQRILVVSSGGDTLRARWFDFSGFPTARHDLTPAPGQWWISGATLVTADPQSSELRLLDSPSLPDGQPVTLEGPLSGIDWMTFPADAPMQAVLLLFGDVDPADPAAPLIDRLILWYREGAGTEPWRQRLALDFEQAAVVAVAPPTAAAGAEDRPWGLVLFDPEMDRPLRLEVRAEDGLVRWDAPLDQPPGSPWRPDFVTASGWVWAHRDRQIGLLTPTGSRWTSDTTGTVTDCWPAAPGQPAAACWEAGPAGKGRLSFWDGSGRPVRVVEDLDGNRLYPLWGLGVLGLERRSAVLRTPSDGLGWQLQPGFEPRLAAAGGGRLLLAGGDFISLWRWPDAVP